MNDLDSLLRDVLTRRPRATVPEGSGVVTLASRQFFPGFQVLYTSVVRTHVNLPVLLWDMGDLSYDQLSWCARQPLLTVQPFPESRLVGSKELWPPWHKAAMVNDAPFARTMWIDSDAVVTDDLSAAFFHVERMPLLIENFWPEIVDPDVVLAMSPMQSYESVSVTTSVLAFNRFCPHQAALMTAWEALSRKMATHPAQLHKRMPWADEDCMRLLLMRDGLARLVWPDRHWSWLVPVWDRTNDFVTDIRELQGKWSGHRIVHFAVYPKPWYCLNTDLLDIHPHANP